MGNWIFPNLSTLCDTCRPGGVRDLSYYLASKSAGNTQIQDDLTGWILIKGFRLENEPPRGTKPTAREILAECQKTGVTAQQARLGSGRGAIPALCVQQRYR